MNNRRFISLLLLICFICTGITTYTGDPNVKTPLLADWNSDEEIPSPPLSARRTSRDSQFSTSRTPSPQNLSSEDALTDCSSGESSGDDAPSSSSSRSLTPASSPNRSSTDSERSNSPLSVQIKNPNDLPQLRPTKSDSAKYAAALAQERKTKNAKLTRKLSGPILPSERERSDITTYMRKARKSDWQYFKNLYKGNLSLTEKLKNFFQLKNLMNTDNNDQTVLHWAIKGANSPEKSLTMHWITLYLQQQLKSKTVHDLYLHPDHERKTVGDMLINQYLEKPFDEAKPETDHLPQLYYGLYQAGIQEPRVFHDVLAWAIARNKETEVRNLFKHATQIKTAHGKTIFDPKKKAINKKRPFDYIYTESMSVLLGKLMRDYRRVCNKY